MSHASALPLRPTMSGPFMTNTSFAFAIDTATMARMAPAMTASPPPMKSLVTVALDMGCLLSRLTKDCRGSRRYGRVVRAAPVLLIS